MRTSAFSIFIFMSLLHKTINERLVFTQPGHHACNSI